MSKNETRGCRQEETGGDVKPQRKHNRAGLGVKMLERMVSGTTTW